MSRIALVAAVVMLGMAPPAAAHEVHVGANAARDPYAPFAFLIGDWVVADAAGGAPLVTLKFHWAVNRAYILCGAYVGQTPHFEGVMMWNGVHHNLDTLLAMDMAHGLIDELGTMSIVDGAAVRDSVAAYSEGVGAGGPLAGPRGATGRTRQTMRPIDADHIAVSFEVQSPSGWRPLMPGATHLLMTRIAA